MDGGERGCNGPPLAVVHVCFHWFSARVMPTSPPLQMWKRVKFPTRRVLRNDERRAELKTLVMTPRVGSLEQTLCCSVQGSPGNPGVPGITGKPGKPGEPGNPVRVGHKLPSNVMWRLLIVLTLVIAVTGTCWNQGREGRTGTFAFVTLLDLNLLKRSSSWRTILLGFQGDAASQHMMRSIARQVCEQLINSEQRYSSSSSWGGGGGGETHKCELFVCALQIR